MYIHFIPKFDNFAINNSELLSKPMESSKKKLNGKHYPKSKDSRLHKVQYSVSRETISFTYSYAFSYFYLTQEDIHTSMINLLRCVLTKQKYT